MQQVHDFNIENQLFLLSSAIYLLSVYAPHLLLLLLSLSHSSTLLYCQPTAVQLVIQPAGLCGTDSHCV